MYKKSRQGKVAQWLLPFFLLCVSNITFGLDDTDWKSNTFSQDKEGGVSLPVRVVPVLVEAPPRRVDLLLGSTRNEQDAKSAASGVGHSANWLASRSVRISRA